MRAWLTRLRLKLRRLVQPGSNEDLREEHRLHLELLEEEHRAAGMATDDARMAARRQFGNRITIQETSHDLFTFRWLDDLARDLRFAARSLARHPGFTCVAVITLALGIGATTAIFSVVYSVLIRPLPYPNAEELVRIRHRSIDVDDLWASPTLYLTYRDESRTLADVGAWRQGGATLTNQGIPERVLSLQVTDGTLQSLGVQPIRGRWFTKEEHQPAGEGAEPVILSYDFWQRRFGGDEAALGRLLTVESQSAFGVTSAGQWLVIGIMPRSFRFLDVAPQPDVITAVRLGTAAAINSFNFNMLARVAPGVTAAEARADIERMLPIWLDTWPIQPGSTLTKEALANWRITPIVRPLMDDLVGGVASALWVLIAAVGAVLLVACANVANLTLVRADSRHGELAVRAALGAVRGRIARELLVESLVLGVIGGALGLTLAYVGVPVLVAIAPSDLPRLEDVAVHPPVLAFAVAISLVSTLAFGLIPSLKQARHAALATGSTRTSSASRERARARSALVVAQVALALVLVAGAALMIRTFQALRNVEPGFLDPAAIQTAQVWNPLTGSSSPEQVTVAQLEIVRRISALAGVSSAGFTSNLPMDGEQTNGPVLVEGETIAPDDVRLQRRWVFVSPGYFEAMGTRVIAGRDMTWSDTEASGLVALISENLALEIAAEPAAALGQRLRLPFDESQWHEVVGVVQNVRQDGLSENPPTTVYWPLSIANRFRRPDVTLAIRSERAGTTGLIEAVRRTVASVNGAVPIARERTLQALYATSLARTSFTLVMLAIAGGMALVLGVVGIHGVIAYVVSQRRREIGIRSALGAPTWNLSRTFLSYGLRLSGIGVAIGLVSALALSRFMSSLLFGVDPMDPAAYMTAVGIIVAAAGIASYLPARRAAAIDPLDAINAE